nr:hypothetical protein [uncultured Trichococcus sp.]
MKESKLFWVSIIIVDVLMLAYSFLFKNWVLSVAAFVLMLLIKHFAYDLLFAKFDKNWDIKHAEYVKRKKELN